ncbi:helix-turn-helix domain-containing protein [Pasteurellaceae bacterium USgator11]|nr:helix-turn-helix domain-containing protein [Pasteurellaceae bacterium USgator41]TNG96468.1 helix-turn-helix domain-containing protein [Pasteurellaceae bacterium UScroc12]TNH00450.1 helix-turn-helix domain-containing protein [Pasteurellaceae bacterium UScroc31]TNH01719.1 helix-turn-helix domain-containing protein [Pasteurellaceae bacterium USgator11]
MDNLKPDAQKFHNPSREYISRLLSTLQQKYSMSEISRRLGVNRSTIYNYLRDESDQRFTPCPYAVQFALEELAKNSELII